MQSARNVLTPDSFAMLQSIVQTGSFAAAARQLGLVPSALTYRVRQMEDALDVLLFDRSARQARPTEAGAELLREGLRLLQEIDAVACRVQRVATGWEPRLSIAVDGVCSQRTMLELIEAFYQEAAPTQLRMREEVLTGTLEALASGRADLAIGVSGNTSNVAGLQQELLGEMPFVFVIAPHHPLAQASEPINDTTLVQHRVVAVADSALGSGVSMGVLAGQEVLTVGSLSTKLQAQLRGLGCGLLPAPMVRAHVQAGHLVERQLARPRRNISVYYAWNGSTLAQDGRTGGRALQWWLAQLRSPATRVALLAGDPTT